MMKFSGLIPESFPLDLDASLSNGIDGLPSHIEFQGRSPPDFDTGQRGRAAGGGGGGGGSGNSNNRGVDAELPNLKPNERSGSCQRYPGTVCSKYTGNHQIFISQVRRTKNIQRKVFLSVSLSVCLTVSLYVCRYVCMYI